jgi:hypothetical protein
MPISLHGFLSSTNLIHLLKVLAVNLDSHEKHFDLAEASNSSFHIALWIIGLLIPCTLQYIVLHESIMMDTPRE